MGRGVGERRTFQRGKSGRRAFGGPSGGFGGGT